MPGVAHGLVSTAVNYGKETVEAAKSKPGVVKWAVETVEKPTVYVLDSSVGKTAVKVGDRALDIADNTIDKAMNTGAYKNTEALVKTTYTNKVQPVIKNRVIPAASAVTTTVSKTTTAVTTPVVNVYGTALSYADYAVDRVLVDKEDGVKESKVTVVGITRKISRRSVKKARAAKNRTIQMAKNTKANASWALTQAKPANLKKNVVAAYDFTLSKADNFVDHYMPDTDGLVAKGPVTLTKKVAKRGYTYGIKAVKQTAVAIKNAPTTFKNSVKKVYETVSMKVKQIANMKIRVKFLAIEDFKPYMEAAQTRTMALVKGTDNLLLNYPLTTSVRNFAIRRYEVLLAPLIAKYVTKEDKKSIAGEKKTFDANTRVSADEKLAVAMSYTPEPKARPAAVPSPDFEAPKVAFDLPEPAAAMPEPVEESVPVAEKSEEEEDEPLFDTPAAAGPIDPSGAKKKKKKKTKVGSL